MYARESNAGFIFALSGFFFFSLLCCGWLTTRTVNDIIFNKECGNYLGRAANASTVEITKEQLKIAITYLEKEKLTEGFTSILYRTPDEDVGYWYKNLCSDLQVLESLPANSTELEKSNTLIRVKETLVIKSQGSEYVLCPEGISIFPHNTLFMFWGWITFLIAGMFFIAMIYIKREFFF